MVEHSDIGLVVQLRYFLPIRIGQRGKVGHENSMRSTTRPRPPVASGIEVYYDLGGVSGPPRLHAGDAKNVWVKNNPRGV